MKKILCNLMSVMLCVIMLGTFSLSLAACEKKDKDQTASELIEKFNLDIDKDVELTIKGTLENFPALQSIFDGFNDYFPNCKIKYDFLDNYDESIQALLEDETKTKEINLFMVNSEVTSGLTEAGVISKYATDFYSPDCKIDISEINNDVSKYNAKNGKLYNIPLMLNSRGLVVNETILSEHNLSIPTNWNEFLNCCSVLKAAGLTPIQGLATQFGICMFYPEMACDIVYDANAEAILASTNAFEVGSGEYFKDEWQKFATLIENEYYVYNSDDIYNKANSNYTPAIYNFFEGDVAFFPCTAEVYSGMEKRELGYVDSPDLQKNYNGFKYSYVGSPSGDSPYIYFMAYHGITVNPQCNNNEWAQAFADFMFREENMQTLAKEKGMISNTNNNVDSKFDSIFALENTHHASQADFGITYYSELTYTFEKMYKLEDKVCVTDENNIVKTNEKGIKLIDNNKVVQYFEGKIASAKAKLG